MTTETPATPLLDQVRRPADMKGLTDKQLRQLADEVRAETVSAVSVTGGAMTAPPKGSCLRLSLLEHGV